MSAGIKCAQGRQGSAALTKEGVCHYTLYHRKNVTPRATANTDGLRIILDWIQQVNVSHFFLWELSMGCKGYSMHVQGYHVRTYFYSILCTCTNVCMHTTFIQIEGGGTLTWLIDEWVLVVLNCIKNDVKYTTCAGVFPCTSTTVVQYCSSCTLYYFFCVLLAQVWLMIR